MNLVLLLFHSDNDLKVNTHGCSIRIRECLLNLPLFHTMSRIYFTHFTGTCSFPLPDVDIVWIYTVNRQLHKADKGTPMIQWFEGLFSTKVMDWSPGLQAVTLLVQKKRFTSIFRSAVPCKRKKVQTPQEHKHEQWPQLM